MKKHTLCEMEFTEDHEGKALLLKDGKYQVMMEWEKPYMQACIDALSPKGDVLEIGFGLGYSATQIQKYSPRSHTIVEYHPTVMKQANKWAESYKNITLVEDTWQNALPKLGIFDEIFFDDYPLESEQEGKSLQKNKDYAEKILKSGREKIKWVHRLFPFLTSLKYSNEDVEEFFSYLKNKKEVEPKVYLKFFSDLKKKQQISEEQFEHILTRLKEMEAVDQESIRLFLNEKKQDSANFRIFSDRFNDFLEECFQNHTRKGSRFSCYLNNNSKLYENKLFLERFAQNPSFDVIEKKIDIHVPAHCEYFEGKTAKILIITRIV